MGRVGAPSLHPEVNPQKDALTVGLPRYYTDTLKGVRGRQADHFTLGL